MSVIRALVLAAGLLGLSCSLASAQGVGGSGIIVGGNSGGSLVGGTTTISGTCTTGYFLYNNGGILGCSASSSSIALPQAVTGGVSGGIPYFSNTTTMSASLLLAANAIMIGGGSGTAPSTDANATLSAGALSLGASGTAGSVALDNATSGVVTLQPVTGALGTVTASLPANTGTIAEINLAQTWSAIQIFGSGNLKLTSAGGGLTLLTPTSSASNFTLTIPAASDTIAELGQANVFTAANTFTCSAHQVSLGTTSVAGNITLFNG